MNDSFVCRAFSQSGLMEDVRQRFSRAVLVISPILLCVWLDPLVLIAQDSLGNDATSGKYCAYFVEAGMYRRMVVSDPFDDTPVELSEGANDKYCDTIDYRSSNAIDHIATLHLADSSRKRRFFLLVDINSLQWARPVRVVVYHNLTVAVNRRRVNDDVTQIIEWIVSLFPPATQIRLREIIADPEK